MQIVQLSGGFLGKFESTVSRTPLIYDLIRSDIRRGHFESFWSRRFVR